MNIYVAGLHISTTSAIFAAVVTGIGVVLIILISLCCYWCCRQKDRRKRSTLSIRTQYTPGAARGNQHGERARQRQQQHNPPRQAEHHVHPNHMPPPVASPLQQPHIHLPSQSSTGSTSSKSPTPQIPSAYPRSKKSNLSGDESSIPPPSPAISRGSSQAMFTYNELAKATKGFSDANFLGEGGFGLVHKGVLPNGKEIAVKSLRPNSGQGEREFEAEVEIISRVHHRHLVALVGYCITGFHRLLVYEFVTNKTLEFHLHGKGQPTLDWPTRMKVALGSAKGLAYLHEDCQPRIIHRDIKATNILLDNKFQAKVADFGLAKLTPEECTHVTTRVMGTLGYLAPEYASSGRLTEKSDVYSFGVMLLELITGRRPIDITKNNLVEWARPFLITAMKDENFNHLVDTRLQFSYKHSEMARMLACAASCVHKSARSRPLMSQVVRALEGNMSLDELNKGITPGHSMVQRYDSASDHSGSQYRRDSEGNDSNSEYSGSLYKGDSTGFDSKTVEPPTREFFTREYGGTTSEYGLHRDSTGFESKAVEPPTREFVTSEYGGTTSEYGLHASSSSDEDRTTNELDSVQVQGNRRHFQNRF